MSVPSGLIEDREQIRSHLVEAADALRAALVVSAEADYSTEYDDRLTARLDAIVAVLDAEAAGLAAAIREADRG